MNLILTGASRGIGRALALALPKDVRLHAIARDEGALSSLAREREGVHTYRADLASLEQTEQLGQKLAAEIPAGATLVHCAGLWPARPELVTTGGATFERAFVVNGLAPLALQGPLLASGRVARILAIGAGIMIKAKLSAKTPRGEDFHWMRTYASTKLFSAIAMRETARAHPEVDVAVVHPGVVRTELGARGGLMGLVLSLAKRSWEAPAVTAERLVRLLARERWSSAGEARWFVEEREEPWPEVAEEPASRELVRTFLKT